MPRDDGLVLRPTVDKNNKIVRRWMSPDAESDDGFTGKVLSGATTELASDEGATPGPEATQTPTSDPSVQSGKVLDAVVSDDGTVFHRRRQGVYPGTPYQTRIQASRPLDDEEMRQMAGLVGYTYAAEIRGESISDPDRDSPYSFVLYTDMTKSYSDDLGMALERFEESLPNMVQEGSPVRKTNRSGPGTQGTRLIDGFGDPNLTFEVYYDDVWTHDSH